MNGHIYLQSLIAAAIGIFINILVSIIKTKKRLKAANAEFILKYYIQGEWPNILLIFLCNAALIYMLPDLLNWKPWAISFVRPFYILSGYSGSSILIAALGNGEKNLIKQIGKLTEDSDDEKENKGDESAK